MIIITIKKHLLGTLFLKVDSVSDDISKTEYLRF